MGTTDTHLFFLQYYITYLSTSLSEPLRRKALLQR